MRILIIGATSFIGGHLAVAAMAQGFEVVPVSRSGKCNGLNLPTLAWSFGQSLPEQAYTNIDCAIHLAHDFNGEKGARLTLDSTLEVARQMQSAGVRRQIFFSSYSAGEHALSLYGKTKYAIEQNIAKIPGMVLVRPGLVLGDGGIYLRIQQWVRKLPIIPLPNGGSGKVPVIKVARLCSETLRIVSSYEPIHEANLFERDIKTLRQLIVAAANEVGRNPWIFPLPSVVLIAGLKIAEFLRLPLPINVDNLVGFIANQAAKHVSTLEG